MSGKHVSPKSIAVATQPIRLQTVKKLKIKRPDKAQELNPCVGAMTAVLSCWAASGYTVGGCSTVEQTLRECMDVPKAPTSAKNPINYHLTRLYPKITGPKKRRGSLA